MLRDARGLPPPAGEPDAGEVERNAEAFEREDRPANRPDVLAEPRFDLPIRWSGSPPLGRALLEQLQTPAGAILIPSRVIRRALPPALEGATARVILQHVSDAYAGRWINASGILVLQLPRPVRFLADRNRNDMRVALEYFARELWAELPTIRRASLVRGAQLQWPYFTVTPRQKVLVSYLGAAAILDPMIHAGPGALKGNGLSLRLLRDGASVRVAVAVGDPRGAATLVEVEVAP